MSRRQSTSKQRIRKVKTNYFPDSIQEIAEEIETLKTHIDILNDDCLPEIFMNSTMDDRLQEKHGGMSNFFSVDKFNHSNVTPS